MNSALMQSNIPGLPVRHGKVRDVYQLGGGGGGGGLLIVALVAVACEAMGSQRLASVMTNLNAGQSCAFTRQLEELDANREPTEKIMEREKRFGRSQLHSVQNLALSVVELFHGSMSKTAIQKAMAKIDIQRRRTLQLTLELAAHAFELEHGQPPKGWNDLVPAYLQ